MLVSRLARSTAGLAIVTAAYWLLRLPGGPVARAAGWTREAVAGRGPTARSPSVDLGLTQLFPEGAWERQTPKVLESDSITLLLKDLRTPARRSRRNPPCTLLFHSHGPWDPVPG